jgi:hypothetical protein
MEYAKSLQQGTSSSDPDLAAVSAASGAAAQNLFDEVLLSFDITPTVSGPLAFQYVFGSEEGGCFTMVCYSDNPAWRTIAGRPILEQQPNSSQRVVLSWASVPVSVLNWVSVSVPSAKPITLSSPSSPEWRQSCNNTAGPSFFLAAYAVYSPIAQPQYNDIFGFFIWNSTGPHVNVAVLPNTTDPVSILTVNAVRSTYYIPNDFEPLDPATAKATELNGLTTLLKTADVYVFAGTTYHVKLGIADGYDSNFDSVVWIRAGSVRFNIKDCVGNWIPHTWGPLRGMCTGACEGGDGWLPEVYSVTVAAANGKRHEGYVHAPVSA